MLFHRGVFGINVACLYHELFDDTVEQQSVIAVFLHIFDKIITMLGRVVKKFHFDLSHIGVDQYQRFNLLRLQMDGYQSREGH